MEVLDEAGKSELKKFYSSGEFSSPEKVKHVAALFDRAKVNQHAKDQMQHFYFMAMEKIWRCRT